MVSWGHWMRTALLCSGFRWPCVFVIFHRLMWPGREVSWHPATQWNWLCRVVVIRSPGQHKCGMRPPVWSYSIPPHWGASRCRESPIPFSLAILPFCQKCLPLVHVRQVSEKDKELSRHEYPCPLTILGWYEPNGILNLQIWLKPSWYAIQNYYANVYAV